jgi:cellulose synthase/poly-beta-1,6-N-acetylglucosamine synthase-like glycosyltransferase
MNPDEMVDLNWNLTTVVFLLLAGIFIFSSLIQIFFQWYFFYRIKAFKDMKGDDAIHPPVSVVICARNELANLRKLIPLLLEQDYPEFEIVIIDDRSDDPMYDFMLEQKSVHEKVKLVRINYTPDGMNPKKFALTMGIRSARHPNLLFTDADCFPAGKHWIRSMAKHMHGKEEIILAYAPYHKQKGFLNLLIRYDTFYTAVQYFSFAMAGLPYMGVGRNLAYKKPLFMKLKGFNKHMPLTGGDDDLFVNRASSEDNVSICLDEESYTFSNPKETWYDWYRQKTRHLSVGKYYKSNHKWLLGLLAATNLLFYFTLIPLLFFPLGWQLAAGGAFLKILNQLIVLSGVNKRLKEPISIGLFPILDFVHCMFIFAFSFPARFSRRATWM